MSTIFFSQHPIRNILFGFNFFGPLESHYERDVELQLFRSLYNAFSNIIASHDTAEDVDEDTLHLGIAKKDLKRFLDSFRCSTS